MYYVQLVNLCFQTVGMGRAVVYISGSHKNIGNDARFSVTGLVIQIAERVWFSETVHQPGLRISGAFGDCSRLFGICDRFVQKSFFQGLTVKTIRDVILVLRLAMEFAYKERAIPLLKEYHFQCKTARLNGSSRGRNGLP